MPKLINKSLAGKTTTTGWGPVAFDANGEAEVSAECHKALKGLHGFRTEDNSGTDSIAEAEPLHPAQIADQVRIQCVSFRALTDADKIEFLRQIANDIPAYEAYTAPPVETVAAAEPVKQQTRSEREAAARREKAEKDAAAKQEKEAAEAAEAKAKEEAAEAQAKADAEAAAATAST